MQFTLNKSNLLETQLKKKREKRHIFHNKLFIIQIHFTYLL